MPEGEEELPKKDENKLESIDKTLREILTWTRFANITKLKEILEKELDTDEKKLVYENTDGANGLKELASISGALQDTIYYWWQKWFRLGLVIESETRKGRMMKIVSLDDVGIRVPKRTITAPSPRSASVQQSVAGEPIRVEGEKRDTV
jgi:hypothetical protein